MKRHNNRVALRSRSDAKNFGEMVCHDERVAKISFTGSTGVGKELLRNAVANITALGPQAALTGPAARGDTAAIARQGAAVNDWDAQTGAAYNALSALALRLAGKV